MHLDGVSELLYNVTQTVWLDWTVVKGYIIDTWWPDFQLQTYVLVRDDTGTF